jgi:predicted RNase H-like HicB family nuclease
VPSTQKEWIKRLQREGWALERGGKHQVKMTKPGHRPTTLPENRRRAYSRPSYVVRRGCKAAGAAPISVIMKNVPTPQPLHVNVRLEDDAYWATVEEFPGVFATGDDLEELRESLAEGIALVLAAPGGEPPTVTLAPLRHEPAAMQARSELLDA